jgi:hypothetical protein
MIQTFGKSGMPADALGAADDEDGDGFVLVDGDTAADGDAVADDEGVAVGVEPA